jgi:hypothetical protein
MRPWQFTFSKANLLQLLSLRQDYAAVFVALVCRFDGVVALTVEETVEVLAPGESEQAWIRVDRRKNEWYSVSGGAARLPCRRPQGVHKIIQALETNR